MRVLAGSSAKHEGIRSDRARILTRAAMSLTLYPLIENKQFTL